MVARRLTAVFDLDGTLYSGASLRLWFRLAASYLVAHGHPAEASKIALYCALSLAGFMKHVEMKRRCSLIVQRYASKELIDRCLDSICRRLNPQVMNIFDQCKSRGLFTLLATASPEIYCRPLAGRLGFTDCISTPDASNDVPYIETRGERKAELVKTWNELHDSETVLVVTDHYHDMPLLCDNHGVNVLVNPSSKTLEISGEVDRRTI